MQRLHSYLQLAQVDEGVELTVTHEEPGSDAQIAPELFDLEDQLKARTGIAAVPRDRALETLARLPNTLWTPGKRPLCAGGMALATRRVPGQAALHLAARGCLNLISRIDDLQSG